MGSYHSTEPLQAPVPLVVDLDGTLIRTDLLVEAFFTLLSARPLKALGSLLALRHGRAALKARIADESAIDISLLPFNEAVLAFIQDEKGKGRQVYLASASDQRIVDRLAEHLGLFDGAFGSRNGINLAGHRKAQMLCERFGEKGFDYIGDTGVDFAVWSRCQRPIVAAPSAGMLRRVQARHAQAQAIGSHGRSFRAYLKALRPHQWSKNLLVFVPCLAAHAIDARLVDAVLAFVSFSLCASSVYLVNDLLDLGSDRTHARKRSRPLASGAVPLVHAAMMAPLLLLAALAICLLLPGTFFIALIGYYVLTLAYSLHLKRQMIIDVIALACLYGARLVAGSAATAIPLSPWLGALAVFLFLSLALVKRCTEILQQISENKQAPAGRGYRLDDLPALESMAAASGYVAVLVMALYLNSDTVRALYAHPNRLWIICVLMLFWISRILLKTRRGEMHDDPVVYAITDRTSRICGLLAALTVIGANL